VFLCFFVGYFVVGWGGGGGGPSESVQPDRRDVSTAGGCVCHLRFGDSDRGLAARATPHTSCIPALSFGHSEKQPAGIPPPSASLPLCTAFAGSPWLQKMPWPHVTPPPGDGTCWAVAVGVRGAGVVRRAPHGRPRRPRQRPWLSRGRRRPGPRGPSGGGGLQGRGSKGSRSSCTHIRCGRRRPHQPTHQPIPPHYPTSGNKLHFSEFEQSPNLAESVYIGSPFPQLAVSSAFLRPTFKHWVKSLYKIELDFAYYFYLFASTSRECPQERGFGGGGNTLGRIPSALEDREGPGTVSR